MRASNLIDEALVETGGVGGVGANAFSVLIDGQQGFQVQAVATIRAGNCEAQERPRSTVN